ncbi:MAG: sterol desaturase family protein, partial [Myxococcota bacterium]
MLVSLLVIAAALLMWLIERFFPARRLPRVRGYWPRAILLNGFQALSVWVVGRRLEPWLQASATPGAIASLDPVLGAAIGYLAITLVYYFWHRARHEVPVLWRWLHQMHHSVSRLEVAASFYKHPLEILANCCVSGVLL